MLTPSSEMAYPRNHYRHLLGQTICDCPIEGTCCECGTPCTDHDLVGDWYWCSNCIDRHLEADHRILARLTRWILTLLWPVLWMGGWILGMVTRRAK